MKPNERNAKPQIIVNQLTLDYINSHITKTYLGDTVYVPMDRMYLSDDEVHAIKTHLESEGWIVTDADARASTAWAKAPLGTWLVLVPSRIIHNNN